MRRCSRCRARNTIGSMCRGGLARTAQALRRPREVFPPAPTGRTPSREYLSPRTPNRRSANSLILRDRCLAWSSPPAASTTPLNETRKFRALPRDRSRRRVAEDLTFTWAIAEGDGTLSGISDQEVEYRAPGVPGLSRLTVTVSQRDVSVTAEALVTVTDSLDNAMTPRGR